MKRKRCGELLEHNADWTCGLEFVPSAVERIGGCSGVARGAYGEFAALSDAGQAS